MPCGDTEKAGNMNCERRPKKKGTFFLQHDNAGPHIGILARETIAEFGWTGLPYLLYSPDLVPSDFHLYGPMKDDLHGKHFTSDNTVIMAIKK
jgi:hypothetical protein